MQSLVFFNKEGDYLNFRYDDISQTYNGDLMFHENSSDTFKTIGLYVFEKISSFEYESTSLALEKFQLFNEYGLNITGNIYELQSILRIEAVNNDPSFRSKWIYGVNFESKYPIGSEIVFNSPIFEFSSQLKSYTVVSSKKGAVMIISSLDNRSFNILYESIIGLTSSYVDKTISGINSIGISKYIDILSNDNLSSWSEPKFYYLLYNGRKLNLVNTDKNDSVVTVKNNNILDKVYYQYYVDSLHLPNNSDLIIEAILKTDLPVVYKGSLNINTDKIEFGSDIPRILKPGTQIVLGNSINNTNFINISNVPTFVGNTQLTYYATASQVLWNNLIYQCVQAYTQSATSSINPGSASYWTNNITYLPVDETLSSETLLYGEVYLTTNKLYYGVSASGLSASNNNELVLAFAGDKYKEDFGFLNIDLYYYNKSLYSDLNYSSEYATVNFYHTKVGATYSIGTTNRMYEKTIEVEETLTPEFNKNISERYSYNIVFTDIDEYGIVVNINGMIYQQEVQWIYSGLNVDMVRTIDKTLRAWLSKHAVTLHRLGIECNLDYLVNFPYIYFDSIVLKTVYPNVPIVFNVLVGTTANFYIQHSNIVFYEIGNALSLTINNKEYGVTFSTDIPTTLSNWIDTYSTILDDYKIYTSSINNTLYFNIKEQDKNLDYTISIGKSSLPGKNSFKINSKIKGNLGALITSNAIILTSATQSTFYDVNGASAGDTGFATGMITSINNTIYPFDNQEYNLLEVETNRLVLSYQGPFWGGTPSLISSPFTNASFNGGFSYSIIQISGSTGGSSSIELGAYNQYEFDFAFDIIRGDSNSYSNSLIGSTTNMIDLVYVNTSEYLYILGDAIKIYDGLSGDYYDTISLPGLSHSLKLLYNSVDDYLYALTTTKLYKIEPSTNLIVNTYTYSIPYTPYDAVLNTTNGDIYISYSGYTYLEILDISGGKHGITSSLIGATYGTYKLEYNQFEDDIYVTTSADKVLRINATNRTEYTSYSVSGLQHTMIYEPIGSSIYVMGSNLNQINNNIITSIPSISSGFFSDILYDNINQEIAISRDSYYGSISLDNSLNYNLGSSEYGQLSMNQYDERIYISSQNTNEVIILDPIIGNIKHTISLPSNVLKLIYNPLRRSMWGILPSINQVVEIRVDLALYIIVNPPYYNGIYDSQYGSLAEEYSLRSGIWLKTRDYIRRPRENFIGEDQVQYVWKWLTDDVPEMFMYDFSGKQLSTTGPYAYIGEKPLENINLNKYSNKDISKTASSAYQQTIFSEIVEDIDYINSSTNISYTPEPLELFLGFNSQDEGTVFSTLLLYKRENINFSIITDSSNLNNITFTKISTNYGTSYGTIKLDSNSTDNFLYDSNGNSNGLKVDQEIILFIKDNTNTKNKYISFNNGIRVKITELYLREIIVKFISGVFTDEQTTVSDYPTTGKITYMTTTFKVMDREIGRFYVNGETEIEDIRYKTELTNAGKNITADDVFIFKTYDINEQGVDWGLLNRKRKEMLMVKDDIFPYVGSYKAIINAINYFGYNDLELYEYYRNINPYSKDLGKLYKVEIPDIFDNNVAGWNENDFIKHTMPNPNYEDTNLFNLTYNITDKDGNNVLLYSLPEVLIKLQGLKYWLQKNVIPLSHKILDITGRTDFVGPNSIVHKSYDATIFNVKQSLSPIDFKVNEAYLMPINSGSTVYTVVVDFYNQSVDPITNYFSVNEVPDYFDLKIRTYKTYPEWRPFKTYQSGDIVSYYQQIYESVIDGNRIHDPRKYQNSESWNINFDYIQGQVVEYKRNFYEFIGTQSVLLSGTSSVKSPFTDVLNSLGNWTDITEWRKLDYVPVQTISEYRTGTHSFHFTVDTNIDPFITFEVTSDNGYGQIYRSKKNYELRSLLDVDEGLGELDEIGPIKVYNFLTSTTTSTTTVPSVLVYDWQPIDEMCQNTNITTSTTTTTTTAAIVSTSTTTTTTTTTCCGLTVSSATYSISSNIGVVVNISGLADCGSCSGVTLGYSADGVTYSYISIGCVSSYELSVSNAQDWYFMVLKSCGSSTSPWSNVYHYTPGPPTTTTTTTTTSTTTTTTTTSLFTFTNSGYSTVSEAGACTDESLNNRTLYSDCSVLGIGCTIYVDTSGTILTGQNYLKSGTNFDISTSGVITAVSGIQC